MDVKHHILRISNEEYLRHVYEVGKYYSGMKSTKGWKIGSIVVFLKKAGNADSIIGHGVIRSIETIQDMTEEERTLCQKNGWTVAVGLKDLSRLDPPKPVNETPIGKWGVEGKLLHGRTLSEEDIGSILP